MRREGAVVAALLLLGGCGAGKKDDAAYEAEIVARTHAMFLTNLQALNQAARDLQSAAPTPADRGWSATDDQAAIDKMKQAWARMRAAWEASEGVLGPAFPMSDRALDARYEDFLADLGPAGDTDLFDGMGVTGMHAVERILYAPTISSEVVDRESTLPGYVPAAWPQTAGQAAELKTGLCAQLVADAQTLLDGWTTYTIDPRGVYEGVTALMAAQEEKVSLTASHEQESRYAQTTLADLRNNLTGSQAVYDLFVPWLDTKRDGSVLDASVQLAFSRLSATYDAVPGDAIPPPPATWSSTTPSVADQQTPFGVLYVAVVLEVDPNRVGSAVDSMNLVATMLGLPRYETPPPDTDAGANPDSGL